MIEQAGSRFERSPQSAGSKSDSQLEEGEVEESIYLSQYLDSISERVHSGLETGLDKKTFGGFSLYQRQYGSSLYESMGTHASHAKSLGPGQYFVSRGCGAQFSVHTAHRIV